MHRCNLKPLLRGAKLLGFAIVYLLNFCAQAAEVPRPNRQSQGHKILPSLCPAQLRFFLAVLCASQLVVSNANAADPAYCSTSATVVLTSQASVDSFQSTYGPCDTVQHAIEIRSSNGLYSNLDGLTNLDGLSGIKEIQGSLSIFYVRALADYSGISGLQTVEGNLTFQQNSVDYGIDPDEWPTGYQIDLPALTTLGGGLYVRKGDSNSNSSLRRLSADNLTSLGTLVIDEYQVFNTLSLAKLKTVTGDVYFNYAGLNDLSGLPSLEEIGGSLTLTNMPNLNNIDALSALATVQNLSVEGNPNLRSLAGLSTLATVTGDLRIFNNSRLGDVDGLSALTSVDGGLLVQSNPSLPDVNGLSGLSSVGADLTITSNGSLRFCGGVYPVLGGASGESQVAGTVSIGSNDPGCNSVEDVVASAGALPERAAYCSTSATVVLTSQASVDSFQSTYGPCDTVQHAIEIRSSNGLYSNLDGLTNLDGLSGIKEIQGSLSIFYVRALADYSGISGLQTVEGNLTFQQNSVDYGIDPDEWPTGYQIDLPALTTLGGGLYVRKGDSNSNSSLRRLSADNLTSLGTLVIDEYQVFNTLSLAKLKTVTGDVYFNYAGLNDLSGLPSLEEIGGSLTLTNMPNLNNIDALSALATVQNLSVEGNPNLRSLAGLSTLATVTGDLRIFNNSRLGDVDGLSALTSVDGGLLVQSNPSLPDVNGLSGLSSVGADLTITSNGSLRFCGGVYPVLGGASGESQVAGTVSIGSNDPGCNSVEDVVASAGALPERAAYCSTSATVVLTSQASVDSFQSTYGPCDTVQHAIEIRSSNGLYSNLDGLTNLDGLSGIKEIQGSLSIFYVRALADYSGISGLQTVEGNLTFQQNSVDYGIDPDEWPTGYQIDLPALTTLGGGLYVRKGDSNSNSSLRRLSADNLTSLGTLVIDEYQVFNTLSLAKLKTVTGDVYFNYAGLNDLSGLPSLEEIGGSLTLTNMPNLNNIDALSALATVQNLSVEGNPNLRSLAGLSTLATVTGDLRIFNNSRLGDVDGLSALTSVDGGLLVQSNPSLPDVNGLSGLSSVGADLTITSNGSLRFCGGVYPVLGGASGESQVAGTVSIGSNDPGCNSVEDVVASAGALPERAAYCSTSATVVLTSQASVDSFQSTYGPCDTVQHAIEIRSSNGLYSNLDGLTNLDGLSGIKEIQGSLSIFYVRALADYSGISGLQTVEGNLTFQQNSVDYGIDPDEWPTGYQIDLPALTTLGGGLYVRKGDSNSNSSLRRLSADNLTSLGTLVIDEYQVFNTLSLAKLKTVTGDVYFNYAGLNDLSGLPSLEEIGGSLTLTNMPNLNNIDALSALATVQNLSVEGNPNLRSLAGLSTLATVTGDLRIFNNSRLGDVDGLSALTSVDGGLLVQSNPSLPDVNGLSGLSSVGADLTITSNGSLRFCGGVYPVLGGASGESQVAGTVSIGSNDPGCNSVEDVVASAGALPERAAYCSTSATVVLTSQASVDSFQSTYGPCDTVQHSIEIRHPSGVQYNLDGLTNLDGLSGIKEIQGSLSISYVRALADYSGISGLQTVEGNLTFQQNSVDYGIDPDEWPTGYQIDLPALTTLGGGLYVRKGDSNSNSSLRRLSADNLTSLGTLVIDEYQVFNTLSLAKLKTVTGDVYFNYAGLNDLSGLPSLEEIGGSLTLTNMPNLNNIDALSALATVQNLSVEGNPNLRSLAGLSTLATVTGDLRIFNNSRLGDVDGLSALTSVDGGLLVQSNPSLPDVNGLSGLSSVGADLTITSNGSLRFCGGVYPVLGGASGESQVAGTVSIGSNDPGCNSVEDVVASAGALPERAAYCSTSATVVLTSQASVDSFQSTYGPCDTVQHSIEIRHPSGVQYNLDGLTNLDGLSGIKEIQGSLSISYVRALADYSGISGLQTVEGNLTFQQNSVDYGIDPDEWPTGYQIDLPALTTLGGGLYVRKGDSNSNSSLRRLSADNLTSLGTLVIDEYQVFNTLSLAKLKTVTGDVYFNYAGLNDLSGLPSLEEIGGSLTLTNMPNLNNIDALSALTAIGGSLAVSNNSRLTDLYGLQFLEVISRGLTVSDNTALGDCVGLATVLGWPFGFSGVTGDTVIENNAEGCNSVQQILDLTADSDGDGYFDTQDQFPEDAAAAFDNDGDGQPDAWLAGQSSATSASGLVLDQDDDNDGVADADDAFPFDAAETLDIDGDGIGDNVDTDRDGDGVSNTADAYPNAAVTRLGDVDGDGRPDNCDAACVAAAADPYHSVNAVRMLDDQDADNDGVPDQIDIAPLDAAIPADGLAKLYFEATGEAIAGPGRNQFSGRYLDLDEDGKTLAIGGLSTVRVFQKQAEGWRQQGAALGSDFGNAQYRRVQLGSDGSTLAVSSENYGAPVESGGAGERSGRVQAYQWATDAWAALGDPIDGAAPGAFFGSALAMDQYGLLMAVGAPGDSESAEIAVGSVTIYEFSGEPGDENNKSWKLTGGAADAASKVWGAVEGGGFGSAVALSRDASVLAVGMIGQEDGAIIPGSVQVFEAGADGYQPRGAAISGKTAKESFGQSIALDQLGSTLAVGADGADVNGENSGVVRVYKWNGAAWVQLGSDIRGEAAGDASGTDVDLSLDGTVVVVGAPGNSGKGISSGQARVYAWNNNAWVQRGPDVDGENATDFSGRTVAISGDGNSFVVGADGNDDGGSNAGQVRMFKTTIEGDPNLDTDQDGVADGNDNCPADANAEQIDTDQDGNGDVCDVDDDNDGYFDSQDTFPLDVTEWADNDADGKGDNADEDDDNDGVKDVDDDFPLDPAQSVNTTDTDGDGVLDKADNCIAIKNPEQANFDEDAAGDACDADDDNDGVPDLQDAFPFDPDKTEIIFVDTDNDGLEDDADNCPLKQNADQGDFDGDGEGNACDPDDDNDGVADEIDFAPFDASRYLQGRQKAIIVAGGGPYRGNALWPATRSMANFAHKSLESQGVDPKDIWYLSYENNPKVDGAVTRAGIQAAITEWASNPADPADDLLVYFVDHGGEGVFELSETEVLAAEDLDGWFDTVEASITGSVTFIYDACQAGSFLPLMTAIEGKQRLVVASTAFDQPALFAADGAISFSYWFWSTFSVTGDIYQSYLRGKNGMGYFQNRQVAQVDVDGDGNGNSKADRQLATGFRFGDGIVQASDEPVIGSIEGPTSVDGATSITLSAVNVQGATRVIRVWAVIDDPDELTGRADEPLIRSEELELQDDDQDGTWQATYDNLTIKGDYQFIVFAQNESGILSTPSEENPSRLVVTQLRGRAPNIGFDSDRDGYADNNDAFPLDASEYLDTDNDLIGDAADPDADGDGVRDLPDGADAFDEDSSDRPLWLAPGAAAVTRNFHTAIDDDFLQFLAIPGGRYAFRVNPLKDQSSEGIDLVAIVSKSDGSGVAGSSGKLDQGVAGEAESLDFGVTAEDKILIRINDFNRLVGKTTDYALSVALETDASSDTEARVVQDARQRAVIAGKAFDLPLKLFWSGVPSDSALVVWLASQDGVSFSGVTGSSCVVRQGFYRCVVPKNGLSGQATINIMVTSASRQTFEVVSYAYVLDASGQLVPEKGFVDNFQVTRFKAGEDADNDGLNDAFELKNGLSTTVDNSETDQDGDGITDLDEYQGGSDLKTVEQDLDGDGIPNIQDADDDGDGVPDVADAFPLISLDGRTDTDSDGYPDDCDAGCLALDMVADADDDNDGVEDTSDAFALDASETADSDNDGVGDNSDVFPDDATESLDSDGDSIGDNVDNCPSLSNSDQLNTDGDGAGNICDSDDDNDGYSDDAEAVDGTDPLNRFSCKAGCFSFDVDESQAAQPLTDGLLVIRHLFGFSGDSLTSGAVAGTAGRGAPDAIQSYLTAADAELDIDGDGESKPLTDGLLLIRYLFGFSGDSLTSGAIGPNATRDTAEKVAAYIEARVPVQ